jgi:8-oxo-dGTP pyrophosphatase MutT (NUDIX family)
VKARTHEPRTLRPVPVHRRLLGPRVLRLGYRVAYVIAHAWWSARGSTNLGVKCVVSNRGEVLLVRHTYGDRRTWDFPGGFVRRREQPLAAVRRELGEELGVDAQDFRDLGSLLYEFGRRSDTVHYFQTELADRRVVPDDVEIAEVGWFDPGSLPRQPGKHVAGVLADLALPGSACLPACGPA